MRTELTYYQHMVLRLLASILWRLIATHKDGQNAAYSRDRGTWWHSNATDKSHEDLVHKALQDIGDLSS